MRLLTITTLALCFVVLPILGQGGDCQVTPPWLRVPLVCPEYSTCSQAKSFCDRKAGADNFTNFACHAGSVVGVYTCVTNSFPSTNCSGQVALNECEQLPIALDHAEHYSVLAGASVSNTGPTTVLGDLGISPGTDLSGFEPGSGEMLGNSSIDLANTASAAGMSNLTAAYIDAASRVLCPISKIGELGGTTLAPGLYKSTSGMAVDGSDLFLDAEHDTAAVWIFQMDTTFTSAVGKKIILMNGAKASNVFWQVGTSGTLGATSTFEGTMMADQSISLGSGAVVNGRILARIASITLISNAITIPSLSA